MNQTLEIAAGILGGGVFTALMAYFAFSSAFRDYVREAVGQVPEIAATVRNEQRMATYDELSQLRTEFTKHVASTDALRGETKEEFSVVRREATEGRRLIHEEIRRSSGKLGDQILQLTNAVGELRGEIKGMK